MSTCSVFSARRLRDARKARGFSPEQLAIALERSFYTVSGWERGRVTPPTAVLPVIADVLGVQIADLFEPGQLEPVGGGAGAAR
jgi:transcriptional regulator with XRE-family HTH domain